MLLFDKNKKSTTLVDDDIFTNSVLANASVTETQFLQRQRLAKNLNEHRKALKSSKIQRKGVIKDQASGTEFVLISGTDTVSAIKSQASAFRKSMQSAIKDEILKSQTGSYKQYPIVPYGLPTPGFGAIGGKAAWRIYGKNKGWKSAGGIFESIDRTYASPFYDEVEPPSYAQSTLGALVTQEQAKKFVKSDNAKRRYEEDLAYERMSDYERFISSHAKDYDGGDGEGRGRARKVWEEKLYREFKWLKPLAKNSTFINKNLPGISKGLVAMSKAPFVGRFIKNPAMAFAGLGIASLIHGLKLGMQTARASAASGRLGLEAWKYASSGRYLAIYGGSAEDVAKPVHSWRSSMGKMFHGGGTEHLATLARYGVAAHPGMDYGQMLSSVGQRIKYFIDNGRTDEAIALADEVGIGASLFEEMRRTGGMFGANVFGKNRNWAKGRMSDENIMFGESTSETWEDIKSFFGDLSLAVAKSLTGNSRSIDSIIRDGIKSGRIKSFHGGNFLEMALDAAQSADDYDAGNVSNETNNTSRNVSFIINGGVSVSADNTQEFIAGLTREASNGKVLSAFDPIYIA